MGTASDGPVAAGGRRRRRLRFGDVDSSGTPFLPWVSVSAHVAAALALFPPFGYWLHRVGLPLGDIVLAGALLPVLGIVAQEPCQRLIGGGRLDNRLMLRLVLALGLFWSMIVTLRLGFLFPVTGVLVAAVHVHWSGSAAWRPALLLVLAGTLLEEVLLHLGLVRSWLPDGVSHLTAFSALFLSVLSMANLGLTALRREETAAELAAAELRFRTLVKHSSDLVLVLDRDGAVTYASAAQSVIRHVPEDLVGRPVTELLHPDDRPALVDQLARVLAAPLPVARELRAVDGDQWLELAARSLLDDPVVAGVLVHVRDVTERRTFQDRLAHAATHDHLTGLINRAELGRRLGPLGEAAGPNAGVALFYIDLDGFKQVNDRLGHAAGDAVLVAVAERLVALLRPEDLVARMGGDEFVAVLPGVPDRQAAEITAERVRELLVQPVPLANGEWAAVGVSLGLSYLDGPVADLEALVGHADGAMYAEKRAKQVGRPS